MSETPLTNERLAEIEARANAASDGPWEEALREVWSEVLDDDGAPITWDEPGSPDAEFIAHARTDVPALIAEVRRLRSLFTEEDAARLRSLADMVDDLDKTTPSMHGRLISGPLRDLMRRIRSAIGETP